MFQREPGWVLPKNSRALTPDERRAAGSPIVQRIVRSNMLWRREKVQHGLKLLTPGTKANRAAEKNARKFINSVFADRPDLADAVTPKYPFGGKRPIMADDLYPAMLLPNVELIPRAVERITPTGVVDVTGEHHEVDVLVLSTGFDTRYLTTLAVHGADGRSLEEAWNGEPEALLGVLAPGFPNFFMMYGPLTNGGAVASMLEEQAKYVTAAIKKVVATDSDSIHVRPDAVRRFNDIIQTRLAGSAFYDANNYYKSPSGRVVTQWSDGVGYYIYMSRKWRRRAWELVRGSRPGAERRWANLVPKRLRRLDLSPAVLHPVRTYRAVQELQQTDRGNAFAAGRAGRVDAAKVPTA